MLINAPSGLLLYLRKIQVHPALRATELFMSIYIISGIVALLILMVSYAFISHSLEKRRIQRQRLLTALKIRQRNFRYLVTGVPPHFLPTDLNTLVYRGLIDTCEQLAKLDPRDPSHQADAILFSSQLASATPVPAEQKVRLQNPAQIKEVRQYLQELARFVAQQEAHKLLNSVQAATYHDQIKRLALQIAIDSYTLQAKHAQQRQKDRLAIHFYTLARKLLIAENATHRYDKQIAQLQTIISKLESAGTSQTPETNTTPAADVENTEDSPINKEWEEFGRDDWKKKQDYD